MASTTGEPVRPRGRAPVARRNDGEHAADFIRDLIVRGEFRGGDRIVPDDIAGELGMSRIPVREGLIALEREGWVVVEPRRGSFVLGIDRQTVADRTTLLGLVYGLIARRAVERGSSAQTAELASRQRELQSAKDPISRQAAWQAFLRQLLAISGSKRTEALLRVMPDLVGTEGLEQPAGINVTRARGTAAIVRAARDHNADAAAAAASDMYRRLGELIGSTIKVTGDPGNGHGPHNGHRAVSFAPASGDGSGAGRVSSYVRERILRGELVPGERIDQYVIAQEVGVSRTPMREAMIALERAGWIIIEPHRGAFVNAFDADTARDHYDFFGLLFGFATRRMADRLDDATLGRLLALNDAVQAAQKADKFEPANRKLLEFIVTQAQSGPLLSVFRAMPQMIPGKFFVRVPGAMQAQRESVGRVCAAISRGDIDAAEAAWIEGMRDQGQLVIALF